jgi:hypothetical protein
MKTRILLVLTICSLLGFVSCQKDNNNTSSFKVMLTDAPYDAQEVNVEIKEVLVKYAGEKEGWTTLNTNAGIYNLLALQNNVQAVLATGNNAGGTIKELRLVLGSANTIKIANQTYPLTIPNGAEAGLKIKVNKKLAATLDNLVVDFDAGLSVKKIGNGDYKLKPVLKIK